MSIKGHGINGTSHRFGKGCGALPFELLAGTLNTCRRLLRSPLPGQSTVIYYHHVMDEERPRFAAQMDHLLRWARPIRADSRDQLPAGQRHVAVTLDDGWASAARNALPELQKRGIPATLFVSPNCLGTAPNTNIDDRLISEAALAVVPELVSIGSHGLTHRPVTLLEPAEAWHELSGSRIHLQQLLRRAITLFSFPYGASSPSTIEMCANAGYQRVFTGLPYPALREPAQFVTGRIRVDPSDTMLEFHLKLMGAYSWTRAPSALKRGLRAGRDAIKRRLKPGTRGTIPSDANSYLR